ncbi:alpha/beta hydrolase family protein [Actinomadura welshii]|uniref:alpha/beta hydrolase family protein n=1 Tax=Actinomadura welshii TaxID=3103817 RepID=UPI00190F50FB|nr:prolyl oligopeptidase family serine peptidase [Actinomadura madurae]
MKTAMTLLVALLLGALSAAPAGAAPPEAGPPGAGPVPAPPGPTSTEVSFTGSGGLTLHGSVLAPAAKGPPRPGVVLVTGSGAGVPREHLRTEAVEFARRGLAVLIYDKRSEGYTKLRRDYSELAGDALGGLRALRAQPGVDPAKVGLWGLSEGGWVAPLAASRSAEAAFVIVVGGNAMTPIRQQNWNETSALRREGVSGSLTDRGKSALARLAGDVGLFAEAHFDAEGVLRRVRQPLLGIWGEYDLQTPPEENPPLFARALRQGGNTRYTFRFFPDADHGAHRTPDRGITRGAELAPGYADLVATWVRDVTGGKAPEADAATPPRQEHASVDLPPLRWWESRWAQLAAAVLFLVAFTAYPLVALVRRVRGRRVRPVSRWPRVLAAAGLAAAFGPVVYLFYLVAGSAPDPGPVLGGRPLPWLILQALAVAAVVAAAGSAVAWRRAAAVPPGERVRLGLLIAAGAVLVPWGLHWGVLLP